MTEKFRYLLVRLSRGATVAALAVAVAVTASTPAAAVTRHHRRAISKSELTRLAAIVGAAQRKPVWHAPGPPVKASVLKGKRLIIFPVSSDIPTCVDISNNFVKLGRKLGAKVIALPSTSGPTSWQTNLGDAISDGAAAVAMDCGVVNAAIAPQLAELKAHGIPVIDGQYSQAPPKFFKGLTASVGLNFNPGMADDLADALVNLKGKPAHILYVTTSQIIEDVGVGSLSTDHYGAYPSLLAAIKKWCPRTCTVDHVENLQTTQWPNDASIIASDLNADPKVNTIIVPFDGAVEDMLTVASAAAKSHPGLKIYAWGDSASDERDVQKKPVFAADGGPDHRWQAYSIMDQVIRALSHKPVLSVNKEFDPNVMFTKKNVASYFTGPGLAQSSRAYGDKYVKGFLKLWGVTK